MLLMESELSSVLPSKLVSQTDLHWLKSGEVPFHVLLFVTAL